MTRFLHLACHWARCEDSLTGQEESGTKGVSQEEGEGGALLWGCPRNTASGQGLTLAGLGQPGPHTLPGSLAGPDTQVGHTHWLRHHSWSGPAAKEGPHLSGVGDGHENHLPTLAMG